MDRSFKRWALAVMAACLVAPGAGTTARAVEKAQEWELVNPTGIVEKAAVDPAARLTTLAGKTVALRWNGKHNGDVALDRLAVLLSERYPDARILKTYETDTSLNAISGTAAESERIARAVAGVKPDLVIASQCD